MRVSKRIQEASRIGAAILSRLGMTSGRVSLRSVSKADLPFGELAMQPVPIVVFTTAHPARRAFHVRDVQGLLKHVELFSSWLPVTQAVIGCMDKVVVVSVRVSSGY